MNKQVLISLQTLSTEFELQDIFALLTRFPVKICGLHHLNLRQNLSLLLVLEMDKEVQVEPMIESLRKEKELDCLQLDYKILASQPPPEEEHRYILTMLGRRLSPSLLQHLLEFLRDKGLEVSAISPLDAEDLQVFEMKIHSRKPLERQSVMSELLELRNRYQIDLALQPDDLFRRNKRLIFLDADKTFIQCEMINEISKLAGTDREVAQITREAMSGKLNFQEALTRRVALLAKVRQSDLERLIYNIPYTPGVERLVRILQMLGYRIGIVSGGFSVVVDHIKNRFRLDYGFANTLEIKNGELTGKVLGDILDGKQKSRLLSEVAKHEGIPMEQVIAVGDGANDLDMLSVVSLGIAFNANQFLRERTAGSLTQPNLDALLYFLGIPHYEVAALGDQERFSGLVV